MDLDEKLWNTLHDCYEELPLEVRTVLDQVSARNLANAPKPKRTKSWGVAYLRRAFGKKQVKPADRPNWRHIGGSLYEVRTQAGFKQAVKHYNDNFVGFKGEVNGYPTIYPSVVVFHAGYHNGYLACEAHAVNQLRRAIQDA